MDTEYKIMVDSLARQFKNFMEIKALEKNANLEYGEAFTNSSEAYRKYIEGMKLIMNGNNQVAVKALEESYRIDTTFTLAAFYLSFAYCHFDWTQARIWALKAYRGKEKLPEDFRMRLEFWRAWFNTQNTNDVINYCNSIMNSETKSRFILYDIGIAYLYLGKYDNSVKMFEKVEKVSSERGEKWDYLPFYTFFADVCNRAGMYDKESEVLENGLILFPDDIELIWRKARLLISKGDTKKATELILKYRWLSKHSGSSESGIENRIGALFEEANSFDQAEGHYRTALKLDPSNYSIMIDLAYFLVNHDRNIEEAQALTKIVLDNDPNNLDALYTEATIRLKEGKFQEAVDLLQAVKDGTLWVPTIIKVDQQISEAKKAVASQKVN